jgi:opacity protein-like surface antigen
MGQLKHDGIATQGGVTAPAGDFPFGDLFRINGINGIALTHIAAADTVRSLDLEISPARIWYVKVPAGATVNQGTYLYWTAGAGLKRGDTDLTATVTGSPVAFVEETKDANNYAAIRVLNVGP